MRSTSTTQTAHDIKELRAEIQRLGTIVKDMPAHAKSDASNVIGFDSRELRNMAKNAGKKTRRFLTDKQRQATEIRDEAEDRITSRPFQAVGAALLSGLLLGGLLRRL